MSLTTQLRGGDLGEWCVQRLVGTPSMAAAVTAAANRESHPVRLQRPGSVPPRHWSEVGGAFGLRLAMLTQQAPPYYALYGLVRAGMVSRAWADAQAAMWPTHAVLSSKQRRHALEMRPTRQGWVDLGPAVDPGTPGGPAEPVLADLLSRTRAYLGRHAPCGQLGTPGVEAGLARVCWLLSEFEDVYRRGQISEEVAALFQPGPPSIEQLRGTAGDSVVTELVALAHQLHASGALAHLRQMAGDPPAGQPFGIAGPVLVHHWADADLLIGDTLADVKTVMRADDPPRTARWLWQILAYAWLDTDDRYHIRSVGLYLARHGQLIVWPAVLCRPPPRRHRSRRPRPSRIPRGSPPCDQRRRRPASRRVEAPPNTSFAVVPILIRPRQSTVMPDLHLTSSWSTAIGAPRSTVAWPWKRCATSEAV